MKKLVIATLLAISGIGFAAAPSDIEIRKVMEYKESGENPVLYDLQLTSEVLENVPTDKLSRVPVDSKASLWLKFMVPKKLEKPTFTVVISKGKIPQKTKEIVLKTNPKHGAFSYRTWVTHKYTKPGDYSVAIYYGKDDTLVKSFNFSVQ